MKRRISLQFIFIIFIAFTIFTVGASFIARSTLNKSTEKHLVHYLDMIILDTDSLSEEDIVEKYQSISHYLRITFIDEQGVVLADSSANDLDNHLNRPELQDIGKSFIRYSDTLNIKMMYMARAYDQGFLRVAIPISSISGFLNDFIGLAIVIQVLIIIVTFLLSSYLIKISLLPFEEFKEILKDINRGHYHEVVAMNKYEEMNDLIHEINHMNQTITSTISNLKSEKAKLDYIINHMNQGICVLDDLGKVSLVNHFIIQIFDFDYEKNINKNYRYLFRDPPLQNAIEQSYQLNQNQAVTIHHQNHYYFISIIYSERDYDTKSSVILILSDITETKSIEKLKKEFFINASHELKSPLTTIIGSLDLINNHIVSDQKTIEDLLKRVSSEATIMNHLVMDMLSLSEFENQQFTQDINTIDLSQITHEIINNFNLLIQSKNTQIDVNNEVDVIEWRHEEIYQILKNIIENGIKYGKQDGHLWISFQKMNDTLKISVKDDGIGIPKQDINRVFERFYRVDKARSRAIGGTGLGLSIVKHIVLNHQGKITLNSVEDQGTEIIINLPIKHKN